MLNHGIKFCPRPENKITEITNLILEVNVKLQKSEAKNCACDRIEKYHIRSNVSLETSNNTGTQSIRSIKKKTKDNRIVATKADKSNTLVLLDEQDYRRKVGEFLVKNNV